MLKESIRMSWQNIRGNKMRTFLTMLGIIIGVTAIIALITTVGSATGEITSQFSALGAGKVSVSISGTTIKHGLNESDLAHIAALDNVAGVDPNVSLRTYAAQDGQLVEDVTLEGRSSDYFSAQDDLIGRGRALKAIDMDRSSHVCIIDQTLASAAFPNEDPLGQSLILHGQQFTVVGVLSEDSGSDLMAAMSASSDGGKAIVPYPAAMRLSGSNPVHSLTLYLKDSSLSSETVDNVKQLLDSAFNYRDSAYSIINLDSLLEDLDALQSYGESSLSGLKCRELVTFHDGFSYFAQAFDLTILEALEEESGSEASAQELKHLIGVVRENDLPAIFTERNGSTSAAGVISRETGVTVYSLDMAMAGDSYFDAMYRNIDTIKEALG